MNHILYEKISFKVAYPWNLDAGTIEVDVQRYPTDLDDRQDLMKSNAYSKYICIHLQNILSNQSSRIQAKLNLKTIMINKEVYTKQVFFRLLVIATFKIKLDRLSQKFTS